MAPVVRNLTVYQGRTFSFTVICVQADGVTPRDLTGYTATMQIRETPVSSVVLATATVGVDALTGAVTAVIPAATTAAYTWTAGVYDIVITSGATQEQVAEGRIGFRQTVTR